MATLPWATACGDGEVEPPENRAPLAWGTIPAQTVEVGQTAVVDVSPYFNDPDGDTLTFSAASSNPPVATVSVAGSAVTILGMAKGATEITVTASDPDGLSARQLFNTTVPNRPPVAGDSIPPPELNPGDSAAVDLTAHFEDPDGDSLSFTAETSDEGVVSTSVSGSVVTVAGVAKGEVEVTVTASDPESLSAEQRFRATVLNQHPIVLDSIPPLELNPGDSAAVDLTAHFEDPDGDSLSFAAETSDEGVVSASVSGSVMTVTGVAKGEVEITVTASDPDSLSAEQRFRATVPNQPPIVLDPISHLELFPGYFAVVDLTAHFEDPDGDSLSFAAETSDEGVVSTSVSGSVMTVTGVAEGEAEITVTATDPEALSATLSAVIAVIRHPDRAALVALFEATGGPHWANSDNWLTQAPLDQWHGVTTNGAGRVTGLSMLLNDLDGPIPPEIGELSKLEVLSLVNSRLRAPGLTGTIPAALARLSNLRHLNLNSNSLNGSIPTELGGLANLQELLLPYNFLSGSIPGELGDLDDLRRLSLHGNRLEGSIPAELGDLSQLRSLWLFSNKLTGPIPGALGNLSRLEGLGLNNNALTGPIPPELGSLSGLTRIWLNDNQLESIPPELGGLSSARVLLLYKNRLTGRIPAELGQLTELEDMLLFQNDLTGSLPPELADMESLKRLWLSDNELTGSVPPEFGDFATLDELDLTNNAGMSGPLPVDLRNLGRFGALLAGGTDLCAPSDAAFQKWLRRVPRQRVARCAEGEPPAVYLVQAAQSREFPTPLVADEQALLRVFVTSPNAGGAGIPPVTATFFAGGDEMHVAEIPAKSTPIPKEVDEGDLDKSSNAVVPDSVLREGLELVVEIDPDSTLHDSITIVRRIPESGRMDVDVLAVPTFDLTAIPFLWTQEPDSAVVDIVAEIARDPESHKLLFETRTLLPVGELEVTAHKPVWTSSRSAFDILRQTEAIRVAEGGTRYYQGLLEESTGAAGVAHTPGWSSFSRPVASTMAHEFGHNMSLFHAPCGAAGGPDPAFPRRDGSIGVWGYDFRDGGSLVAPKTPDLMSYCGPRWIGDYHFGTALRYRMWAEGVWEEDDPSGPPQALLLWGGVDAGGRPFLDPAFVIDAPAPSPTRTGGYRLSGHTADDRELFSISFAMTDVADGDGSRSFAFALPTRPEWAAGLVGMTLEGPGGSAALGIEREAGEGMAMLRDPGTGQVRGFVRVPEPGLLFRSVAMALAAEPGLLIQFSTGIPDAEAWRR
ncbi:MAG: hypothetical protein OXQ94_07015 [Gemmatimonadota bacterium]|nr:hypothetical protein [Gemmatimonadota bacterium]MDE2871426.1 hypothetical protein [Gemmatimonadota bacterium]